MVCTFRVISMKMFTPNFWFFVLSNGAGKFTTGEHFLINLNACKMKLAPIYIFFSVQNTYASVFFIEKNKLAQHLKSVAGKPGNLTLIYGENSRLVLFSALSRWSSKIKTIEGWPACMTENSVKQEIIARLNQPFYKHSRANRFTLINVQQLLSKFQNSTFFVKIPLE